MKSSSKRASSLLISGALMLSALVFFVSLTLPVYQDILELRSEFASQSVLLEKAKNDINTVQQLKVQYENDAGIIESLFTSLPKKESVSSIMAQINAISGTSGAILESVDIGYIPIKPPILKLASARGIGVLRINLSLIGNYSTIKRFIQLLETNIRLMDIQSLNFSQSGSSDQNIYNFSILVDTYYQAK